MSWNVFQISKVLIKRLDNTSLERLQQFSNLGLQGLLNNRSLVLGLVSLRWGPRICVSSKVPGDADVGLGTLF